MSAPIIFYDIPNKSPTCKAWSPNTWKVRFALNIKGLNYKTEWIEYPDIEALYHKLNLPAKYFKKDGSSYYCLPVIHDPSTNTTMLDSFDIIQYLDKTYPTTPPLITDELAPLHAAFVHAALPTVQYQLWNIVTLAVSNHLNERSEEYYRRTREADKGKKLEDICTEKEWKETEEGFGTVLKWLDRGGEGRELFLGDKISFPDLQIVGWLLWAKVSLGEDSVGWERICGWHGGRWKKIHDRLTPFMKVV
ncbi:glutathione transferase GTE1 [Irpex rosettiformis]|uniref:Glutathione transferase GTE1 n=1 Tax=Irpex rosettiformis TaxID=378272 RepID=A0ACB8TYH5_9APHY|nr:glutathione transferase GTE1 [Irpex rosettiformis]